MTTSLHDEAELDFTSDQADLVNAITVRDAAQIRAQARRGVSLSDPIGRLRPLEYAIINDLPDIVELLLQLGADPTLPGSEGIRSIPLAAIHGRTACLKILLAGASPTIDLLDDEGATALHWAARAGHHEALTLLLQAGARTDIRDNEDWSAWDRANLQSQDESMRLIEDHEATP